VQLAEPSLVTRFVVDEAKHGAFDPGDPADVAERQSLDEREDGRDRLPVEVPVDHPLIDLRLPRDRRGIAQVMGHLLHRGGYPALSCGVRGGCYLR
jgi:hypothetical protein